MKQENLKRLRINCIKEQSDVNTYKPEVNKKSEEIILNKSQDSHQRNPYDRLYNDALVHNCS